MLFDSVPPGKADPAELTQLRNLLGQHPPPRLGAAAAVHQGAPQEQGAALHPRRAAAAIDEIDDDERELGQRDVEALGFVNLFYYFSAAADRYQMSRSTSTPRCSRPSGCGRCQPHDYYWGRHINGHLDIAEVPGDHHAMFFPENAPRLAEVLSALLERHDL